MYQQLKDSLIEGPMSEQTINPLIDQWANQIRNATIEADLEHNDALKLSNWENSIIELKAQLEYARNK